MRQNSIFLSFLTCSLMVLETNLVGGKAMWLDMYKAWLLGGFYHPNWERGGGSTYPYAQLTPPSPKPPPSFLVHSIFACNVIISAQRTNKLTTCIFNELGVPTVAYCDTLIQNCKTQDVVILNLFTKKFDKTQNLTHFKLLVDY